MSKKHLMMLVVFIFSIFAFSACAGDSSFVADREINVISREAGSGTRGAFIELLAIVKDGADQTSVYADVANGTSIVITSVANNMYSIGYISIGSLGENVKSLSVNNFAPTAENIVNGTYPLFRTFFIVIKDDENPLRDDFISFILSAQGQEIAAQNYVPVWDDFESYLSPGLSGTVVVAGSTSVYPVMSRLAEAYMSFNPGIYVEVHSMGSSAGINQTIEGNVDIGMSSRNLNEKELEQIKAIAIAYDGLAIIVNPENPVTNLSLDELSGIFVGNITRWSNFID